MTGPLVHRGHLLQAALSLALLLPGLALAHEGHDDPAPAVSMPTGHAAGATRFVAGSDQFELVGALDETRLVLWLDRAADNVPVTGARIELDVGPHRVVAAATADTYQAALPDMLPPGPVTVTATVMAGADSDLLAADLVVPPPITEASTASAPASPSRVLPATLATLGVAGVVGWLWRQRRAQGTR